MKTTKQKSTVVLEQIKQIIYKKVSFEMDSSAEEAVKLMVLICDPIIPPPHSEEMYGGQF